jgi:hypothetical protein
MLRWNVGWHYSLGWFGFCWMFHDTLLCLSLYPFLLHSSTGHLLSYLGWQAYGSGRVIYVSEFND